MTRKDYLKKVRPQVYRALIKGARVAKKKQRHDRPRKTGQLSIFDQIEDQEKQAFEARITDPNFTCSFEKLMED